MKNPLYGTPRRATLTIAAFVIALLGAFPIGAAAQDPEPLPVPDDFNEPQGFLIEPDLLTRAAIWVDRHMGKGDLTNGFYVDYGKLIPGAGWLSVGPGYRQWFGKDRVLLDGSLAWSINDFKSAQTRVELFPKRRLSLGAQVRWFDYEPIDYFGVGPDTRETSLSTYGITGTHAVAHATLRPARWFDITGELGLLSPDLQAVVRGQELAIPDQPTFVPGQLSLTIDTRNFPEHPTKGLLLRGAAAHFEDRDSGAFTFRRYEGEFAGFIPMAGERLVLTVHGWAINTPPEYADSVPFYLLPSLGGANTLRSYTDFRFHDLNMAVANVELRLAAMTHVDVAMFVDAGNVARRFEDLNLDKQSYGAGLRFHTRRQTFARLDVANGDEGWRVLFRLTDPFAFARIRSHATLVPTVP